MSAGRKFYKPQIQPFFFLIFFWKNFCLQFYATNSSPFVRQSLGKIDHGLYIIHNVMMQFLILFSSLFDGGTSIFNELSLKKKPQIQRFFDRVSKNIFSQFIIKPRIQPKLITIIFLPKKSRK